MASKKGIIASIGILGAITAASFLVWAIPQTYDATFVVSDYEGHLDGIKNVHTAITVNLDAEFEYLVAGSADPDEYIRMAEASSTQINSQIIQIVGSDADDAWMDSYIAYIEALKTSNMHIRETIVLANMIKDGASQQSMADTRESIDRLKKDVQDMIVSSDNSRP